MPDVERLQAKAIYELRNNSKLGENKTNKREAILCWIASLFYNRLMKEN